MGEDKIKTSISMPRELMQKARIKAIERRTTVSDAIRAFLEKWIEEEHGEDERPET